MALTVREFIKKLEEIKNKDSIVIAHKTIKNSTRVIDGFEYDYDVVALEDYLGLRIILFDKDIEEKDKI